MELNIRGEMEAAAASLEAEGQSFEETATEDASPASETASTSEVTEQPAAEDATPATEETPREPTQDAEQTAPEDDLPVGGSIPVPRVRKIIANARAKAAAEAEARARAEADQVAWAKTYQREQVEQAVNLARFAQERPQDFVRYVMEQARAIPELAPLVGAPSPAPVPVPQGPQRPPPDVLLDDGRLVYSAEQLEKLLDWQNVQVEAKVAAKVRPLEEQRQAEVRTRAIEEESRRLYQEALTWPGMDDVANRTAVGAAMAREHLSMDAAYRKVVVPKLTDRAALEKSIREQVIKELQQKSRASTLKPVPAPAPQRTFGSIREALEATASELGYEED